jgi:aryl-alcohol dehydrogenase-like predicted oxidoreductase
MVTRKLGAFDVHPIGLGCMSMSFAYGNPPAAEYSERLLREAIDSGYTHFDTASLYGMGHNEELLGRVLSDGLRDKIILASKCGIVADKDGTRRVDGRPENIIATCEESLQRLQTDCIDLYYLHRRDFQVPIEESMGALAQLVQEGKIRSIGLSEVSADTLRRAHAVHPVAAVQSEYSLCSRNVELKVLAACKELGTTFVAFSPVARAFLTGKLTDSSQLPENDLRRGMPRFIGENFQANLRLLPGFGAIAEENNCTMAQLSLAWVLAQGEHIVAIPGTASIEHMHENLAAEGVSLDAESLARLDALINEHTVHGQRYNRMMASTIDTEGF